VTLPIATETIVGLYIDKQMTEQEIAKELGCSQQMVGYRLRKAGVSLRRSNKRYLHARIKPHMPVLLGMVKEMKKRRKSLADFVVDPRNPDAERVKMAESLVLINREIAALEVVTRK
jgi:predicted transcriptional regulator